MWNELRYRSMVKTLGRFEVSLLGCAKYLQYYYTYIAPSPPLNVMATAINSRNASISWTEPASPNGIIQLYNIMLTDEFGSTTSVTSTELSLVLEDLRPFTNYTVVVNAMNSLTGENSIPVNFATMEDGE